MEAEGVGQDHESCVMVSLGQEALLRISRARSRRYIDGCSGR